MVMGLRVPFCLICSELVFGGGSERAFFGMGYDWVSVCPVLEEVFW